MKSKLTIAIEGSLYAIVAAGAPVAAYLGSDQPYSGRALAAVSVGSLVAAANAIKAFLSVSFANSPTPPENKAS
jgi:hypothetical protein